MYRKVKKGRVRAVMLVVFVSMLGILLAGCNETAQESKTHGEMTAEITPIVAKPLGENLAADNPFMAQNESIIHNDVYSSDVTEKIVPLGIYSEITSAKETEADKGASR